jgi:hypothetical protein
MGCCGGGWTDWTPAFAGVTLKKACPLFRTGRGNDSLSFGRRLESRLEDSMYSALGRCSDDSSAHRRAAGFKTV